MTERQYQFGKGTPFTVGEAHDGNVILRFRKNNQPHEITITPAKAGEYARRCFSDPAGFTAREQLLLNAWCLGQRIVAEAMPSGDESVASSSEVRDATQRTGAPKDQPAAVPAGAPVSSCRATECG